MKEKKSKLTFLEATGLIVGHGIGSGVLSVPVLASKNSVWVIIGILILAYIFSSLLHLVIAELSFNNKGAQFVKCMENELFKGKLKKIFSILTFALLGLSVLFNCCSYIVGSATALKNWFGLNEYLAAFIYYLITAVVVFFGLKIVGICEKYSVILMIAVVLVVFVGTLLIEKQALPTNTESIVHVLALFGMVSFSLSAVMSAPQVVKGLDFNKKQIRGAILLGLGISLFIIALVTFMTLISVGGEVSSDGALIDISRKLSQSGNVGWLKHITYGFTILALSTSFWANSLNLRDIIVESTKLNNKVAWILSSAPSLALSMLFITVGGFLGTTTVSSVIQIFTGIVIIFAYRRSRKRTNESPLLGKLGATPFQIIVIVGSVLASLGSVLRMIL